MRRRADALEKETPMTDRRMTNFLLLVIAACLVLIVVKLYDVDLVTSAQAGSAAKEPVEVTLVYETRGNEWKPVNVDNGALEVKAKNPSKM
jgi:hypothetical protein